MGKTITLHFGGGVKQARQRITTPKGVQEGGGELLGESAGRRRVGCGTRREPEDGAVEMTSGRMQTRVRVAGEAW